ncbi:hypothetical protein WH52_10610 [Tenacibaculum holothuriorum]|uniref:Wadjet protein JetD C-terminal domain-containing protein n=1 Tax=Tenacibaculum holothuriorum TaxID=1635173 RepID=A0A1Y2PCZ1_9FLAO|nr:Wadjet anti-phage system protein JetD domain-containing protein [Tenacibaculum holothuriorum]OSY87548.1 hypothetical protein WH52_10610 [Tenacibaculum holothuriorum]
MISSAEIKKKAKKSYATFLSSLINQESIFPLEIRGNKSPGKTLETYRKEMDDLLSSSKANKTYAYTIDCVKTKTRFIGSQSLPKRIYFSSEQDYVGYLNKTNEVKKFKELLQITLINFPKLKEWLSNNPLRVIAKLEEWDDILKVISYFGTNSNPNLYIRELPIKVHTKFIERNKSILRELLDIVVVDSLNNDEKKHFESRFNLKYNEPLVRFRLLDKLIAQNFFSGLEDVTIKISDFSKLDLSIKKVLIVENLMNLLTLPSMPNTMAIFGQGFKVLSLKNIKWLKECQIYYWGDLDAQGFEILSGFRSHYKQTKSLMMDKVTFDKYYEDDLETKSKVALLSNLNEVENQMHQMLFTNKWRLEQEKIPMDYTLLQLKTLTEQ